MGRKRKRNKHLPQGMTQSHGSYYLRRNGKWINLGRDYAAALHKLGSSSPVRPTFTDLIDRFRATRLHPDYYSDNTIRCYLTWLKSIEAVFGITAVEDFTQQWAHRYRAEHKRRTTANRHVALISTLLAFAVEIGWIPSNPMVGYRRPPSASEPRRRRIITDEEWAALLKAADPPMALLLRFARYTALRKSDIGRVAWADIREDGLHVTPQKTRRAREGVGVPMIFTIEGDLAAILAAIRAGVPHLKWVFPSRTGKRLTGANIDRYWVPIKKAAGVDCWFHDIRRTRLTEVAEGHGKDAAQRLAGHLDSKSTEGYLAPAAIRIGGL